MSLTEDTRVVSMQFNNRDFERNAQQSLNTISKLKQSMNFDNSAKSLNKLSDATKGLDFNPVTTSVEKFKMGFSALDAVAFSVINNLTNSMMGLSKEIAGCVTGLQGINDGFGMYELKMNSVQTIMSATGEDMDTVNGYMEDLNDYAVKTVYSLSDMTANIAKFTNNGVKLGDAVDAIKGISNEAALSGANAQEASRAMYNFSQALSQGCVKLIDWKSIENANMATVGFKEELIKTAVACGTLIETEEGYKSTTKDLQGKTSDAFQATKGFNESLSSQWMTTEVLTKTLKNYADENTEVGKKAFAAAQDIKTFSQMMDTVREEAATGWSITFETLFGDMEEAKKLWTSIGNVIQNAVQKSYESRNKMLKDWKELGGRKELIDALASGFESVSKVVGEISKAFREVFPKTTGKDLKDLTDKFSDFIKAIKPSEPILYQIHQSAKRLFEVLKFGINIVKSVFKVVGAVVEQLVPMAGSLSIVVRKISVWINTMAKNLGINLKFGNGVKSLTEAIEKYGKAANKWLKEKVADFHLPIVDVTKFTDIVNSMTDAISDFGKAASKWIDENIFNIDVKPMENTSSALDKVSSVFDSICEKAGKIKETVVGVFLKIGDVISDAFDANSLSGTLDIIGSAGATAGLASLTGVFVSLTKTFREFNVSFGSIPECLESLKGILKSYQKSIEADVIKKIAVSIAILAGSLLVLSLIKSDKLMNSIMAISTLFGALMGSMAVFSKFTTIGDELKIMGPMTTSMIKMSSAVLILSIALKQIADIPQDKLLGAIITMTALLGELLGMAAAMSKIKDLNKGIKGIVKLAVAVNMFAVAVKILGSMDTEACIQGVVALGAVLAELVVTSQLISTKKMSTLSAGLLSLSVSIGLMTVSIKALGSMEGGAALQGVICLGAILAELAVTSRLIDTKKMGVFGLALLSLGGSLMMFANVAQQLGEMSLKQALQGVACIGAMLGEIVLMSKLMTTMDTTGILAVSILLVSLSSAFKSIAELDIESIQNGLIGFGGALLELSIGLIAMQSAQGGAATLLIAAPAMVILAEALKILGSLDLMTIVKGLGTMAATLAILGIASAVLGPMAPSMLAVSAALAVFGAACLAIGGGVALLGVGISALGASLPIFAASLGATVVSLSASLLTLAKTLVVGILQIIIQAGPLLIKAVMTILMSLLSAINDNIFQIVDMACNIVVQIVSALAGQIPKIIKVAVEFVCAFIDGVAQALPKLIDCAINFIITFIDGLASAITNNADRLATAVENLILSLIDLIIATVMKLPDLLMKAGEKIGGAFEEGFGCSFPEILGNLGEFLLDLLGAIADTIGDWVGKGIDCIKGFAKGIKDKVSDAKNAVCDMVKDCINGIKDKASEWIEAGKNAIQGFIGGIRDKIGGVVEAAKDMANSAVEGAKETLDIHSPSRVFAQLGAYVCAGFTNGMRDNKKKVQRTTEEVFHIGELAAIEIQRELNKSWSVFHKYTEFIDQDGNRIEQTAERAADAFKKFRASIKESLQGTQATFDEFTFSTETSMKNMLTGLKSQNSAIKLWAKELRVLIDRGLNQKLAQTFVEMGTDSAAYVDALTGMTDKQLKAINNAWEERIRLNDTASNEIINGFIETGKKMSNATEVSLIKMKRQIKEFKMEIENMTKSAMGLFDVFDDSSEETAKSLTQNIQSQTAGLKQWAKDMRILSERGLDKGMLTALKEMGVESAKYTSTLVTMTDKELKKLNKVYRNRLKVNKTVANELTKAFYDTGKKNAQAYEKGLNSTTKKTSTTEKTTTTSKQTIDAKKTDKTKTKTSKQATKRLEIQSKQKTNKIDSKTVLADKYKKEATAVANGMKKNLSKIVNWTYKDALKETQSTLDYGKGTYKQFCNYYLRTTQTAQASASAIKEISDAIAKYNDAATYQTQTDTLKKHQEELAELQSSLESYQSELDSLNGKYTIQAKDRTKELTSLISETTTQIDQMTETVKEDEQALIDSRESMYAQVAAIMEKYGVESLNDFTIKEGKATKNIKLGTKALNAAKKAIEAYGTRLYELSDYYEEDIQVMKEYESYLTSLRNEQTKLEAEMATQKKKNTKASKARIETIKQELSQIESAISDTQKAISKQEDLIAKHTKAAFNETRSSMKSMIESFLDPLNASYDTGIDIFTKFEKADEIVANDLLDNMQSQVTAIDTFEKNLLKLKDRGLSEGLLDQLKSMGPTASNYIDTFMNMTTEQINEANLLFAQSAAQSGQKLVSNFKDTLSKTQEWATAMQELAQRGLNQTLLEELGSKGVDGLDQVKAFLSMDEYQMAQLNETYEEALKIPDTVTDKVIASFAMAGASAVDGFTSAIEALAKDGTDENKALQETSKQIGTVISDALDDSLSGDIVLKKLQNGILENVENAKSAADILGNEILNTLDKILNSDEITKIGKKAIENLKSGMESEGNDVFNNLPEDIQDKFSEVFDKINRKKTNSSSKISTKMKTVGIQAIEGLSKGLTENTAKATKASEKVATSVTKTMKNTLGIHSPSKVFAEIGKYICYGLSKGITGNIDTVESNSVSALKDTIQGVKSSFDENMDMNPTVRPVLDLTEIQNGTNRLGNMLDSSYTIKGTSVLASLTSGNVNQANNVNNEVLNSLNDLQKTLSGMASGPSNYEMNNEFVINSQTGNPKEIAQEVSRILQHKVERRELTWA